MNHLKLLLLFTCTVLLASLSRFGSTQMPPAHWDIDVDVIGHTQVDVTPDNGPPRQFYFAFPMLNLPHGVDMVNLGESAVATMAGRYKIVATWVDNDGRRGAAATNPPPPDALILRIQAKAEVGFQEADYNSNPVKWNIIRSAEANNGFGDTLEPISEQGHYIIRSYGTHLLRLNGSSGVVEVIKFLEASLDVSVPNDGFACPMSVGMFLDVEEDNRFVLAYLDHAPITYRAWVTPEMTIWDGVQIPLTIRKANVTGFRVDLGLPVAERYLPWDEGTWRYMATYAGYREGPLPTAAEPHTWMWGSSPHGLRTEEGPATGSLPSSITGTLIPKMTTFYHRPFVYDNTYYDNDATKPGRAQLSYTFFDGARCDSEIDVFLHREDEHWQHYKTLKYHELQDPKTWEDPFVTDPVWTPPEEPVNGKLKKKPDWKEIGLADGSNLLATIEAVAILLPASRIATFLKLLGKLPVVLPQEELVSVPLPIEDDFKRALQEGRVGEGVEALGEADWRAAMLTKCDLDLYHGLHYGDDGYQGMVKGYLWRPEFRERIYYFEDWSTPPGG